MSRVQVEGLEKVGTKREPLEIAGAGGLIGRRGLMLLDLSGRETVECLAPPLSERVGFRRDAIMKDGGRWRSLEQREI